MHTSRLLLMASGLLMVLGHSTRTHSRELSATPKRRLACRSPPLGQAIRQCTTPGQAALTFDDGPWQYTRPLLDLLDELDVRATFFLVGNNYGRDMASDDWAPTVRRMYDSGHQLASHTYTHPDLSTLSWDARATEMRLNDDAFRAILPGGIAPTYARAPFLSCDEGCVAQMAEMRYYLVDANLDTKDYLNNTPDTVSVSEQKFDDELGDDPSSESYIVLAHDVHETTVSDLTRHMVETLRERGFELVTVGECLGDEPGNWYR